MLRKQLTVLGTGCFLAMSVHSALALSNSDRSLLTLDGSTSHNLKTTSRYIIQLKDQPAISGVKSTGIPLKADGVLNTAKYDANSVASITYRNKLVNKQRQVMSSVGVTEAIYTYEHAFNGFAAVLTETQIAKLKSNPEVLNIWPDEVRHMDTSNTPSFLGLTAPGGLHTLGNKGENMIIGVVDSGVWPENPSLDDAGFDPIQETRPEWPAPEDACDVGTDPLFSCNNKLIGARYFNSGFAPESILPGEFDSPRDADGHGTHTITTAGGNENVSATILGLDVGTVTGMAPRARVAAYKVCWNGSAEGNSGCFPTDSVAAIDAAVADGVDVINYSISGSTTTLVDPVHVAFFNAAQGGVFSSLSAGNSGPGAQTVAHNVPWVTTVGASTYDGDAEVVGKSLNVSYGDTNDAYYSLGGSITSPIPDEGLSGQLVATSPVFMCDEDPDIFTGNNPITNAEEIDGNIALISRGSCAFSEKILYAQEAGAIGVVVYSTAEAIVMGGESTGINIPGVMISNSDGLELVDLVDEMVVSVTLTNDGISGGIIPQIGNQMAGFSSRGESLATADIIKPDITAPGQQILAGTSGSQIDSGQMGESYAYLSGTSMSSPHIAGLATLVREAHPTWSPAAVKSAIMTTARQNLTKEDGLTAADPFDYGAGHVDPNSAVDPGLVYDANFNDYYAFLCGQGEQAFVESDYFPGACAALEVAGFPTDASDLNLASIAIEQLADTQTITRYVTNVSDSDSYVATVNAPEGVDVTVSVYDFATGTIVDSDTMSFNDIGLGIYQLTFTKNDSAVEDEWVFGDITWSDGSHDVRSPIAIKPTAPLRVIAPETVNMTTTSSVARVTLSAEMGYNGRLYAEGIGLDTADVFVDTVYQDADQEFAFNEGSLGFYFVDVPEGTRIAKFALYDEDQATADVDLDLYVYACPGFSCSEVGSSLTATSNESVVLIDPEPLANLGNSDIYVVFVHGYSLGGEDSVLAPLHVWTVDESGTTKMTVRASSRAVNGRTSNVYVGMYGLQSGENYVGGVIYKDENGDENALTVLDVEAQ
ncbi:S8 family serine peptidase [Aliiglaciecola sp. 2_MG-2023]|uniref:S8 family serine peptidase n=1 Tax=unclassified Aliiglaciecola TaxID=2593648 RepID=UPI0026E21A3E|nr:MULTISPECIES: S8 family serine peptidase [unclassified Aliiglaciecola]MDO6713315.1 S8 family serine peptidase [Aliiglaciecola sp. 2_MG-2023]MDO6754505.1 S8 family serine peptidase [Aliiglaciecola sp. 1_MG-2023]